MQQFESEASDRTTEEQIRGVHGNENFHSHGILMAFPWNFHGNGSTLRLLIGMGMGIILMGMGIAYFIGKNKIPTVTCSDSLINVEQ